jgi:hypothetical protein
LLPRQSSIDFQNGKFFFPLKKNGGREILKKMEEKFSVLNSDEIGGGSKKEKRLGNWKVALAPNPPVRGQHVAPLWYYMTTLYFKASGYIIISRKICRIYQKN